MSNVFKTLINVLGRTKISGSLATHFVPPCHKKTAQVKSDHRGELARGPHAHGSTWTRGHPPAPQRALAPSPQEWDAWGTGGLTSSTGMGPHASIYLSLKKLSFSTLKSLSSVKVKFWVPGRRPGRSGSTPSSLGSFERRRSGRGWKEDLRSQ